uniref:EF-hand domain-containing protein n=1 Tax=Aegilops tauschii subsp. strangulata TaxID=200361 RepID=A0A453HR36_AEGTS
WLATPHPPALATPTAPLAATEPHRPPARSPPKKARPLPPPAPTPTTALRPRSSLTRRRRRLRSPTVLRPEASQGPYGAQPPSSAAPYGGPPAAQPYAGGGSGGYGSPFAALVPSTFPPGTDPNVVACFQAADRDGSGMIDDKELQSALSGFSSQSFSLRTVHLLMYLFTNTNVRKIGPKEFTSVFYSLQNWRGIFERFDRDRSGRIDAPELRDALLDLGYSVSPTVLDLLVSKFDKTGGKNKAVEYDNFIECCLTVKGLTEKFKEKDTAYSGYATFGYEAFMLTVLPFLIA